MAGKCFSAVDRGQRRESDRYDTPYSMTEQFLAAHHHDTSLTAVYQAAQRFIRKNNEGKTCHLIYLGDHDPSGLDITRDIEDRFNIFGANCEMIRLALNYDQVEEYNPPPNPAKLTDTRARGYIRKFGKQSWELDALEPSVIEDMIKDKIREFINPYEFEAAYELEMKGIRAIEKATENLQIEED